MKRPDPPANSFSNTEHVLWSLAGGIPPTPDGSGVRAALTNNKLEQGEGKQQQYLCFPLQRALFLDRKIGQVRGEQLGKVGGVASFQKRRGRRGISRGGFIRLLI